MDDWIFGKTGHIRVPIQDPDLDLDMYPDMVVSSDMDPNLDVVLEWDL